MSFESTFKILLIKAQYWCVCRQKLENNTCLIYSTFHLVTSFNLMTTINIFHATISKSFIYQNSSRIDLYTV